MIKWCGPWKVKEKKKTRRQKAHGDACVGFPGQKYIGKTQTERKANINPRRHAVGQKEKNKKPVGLPGSN